MENTQSMQDYTGMQGMRRMRLTQNRYRIPLIVAASSIGGLLVAQYLNRRRKEEATLGKKIEHRVEDVRHATRGMGKGVSKAVAGTTRTLGETVTLTGKTLAEMMVGLTDSINEAFGGRRKSFTHNIANRFQDVRHGVGERFGRLTHIASRKAEDVGERVAEVREEIRAERRRPRIFGRVHYVEGDELIPFDELKVKKQREVARTIDHVREAKRVANRQIRREGQGGSFLGRMILPVSLFMFVRYLYRLGGEHRQPRSLARMSDVQPASMETGFQERQSTRTGVGTTGTTTGTTSGTTSATTTGTTFERARGTTDIYGTTDTVGTTGTRGTTTTGPDDLKIIEGIGPAIAEHLKDAGITTFHQLANTDVARLEEILSARGIRSLADPHTWPEQARLAAEGDWTHLDELKNRLKAGRR